MRAQFPDTIFLSEAFTKPKMMKALAKAGFIRATPTSPGATRSRSSREYFTELTQTEMREYFRGNLCPNTPDILPFHLQEGGRPAFMIRAVLAATLSSVYGIYSGFELCENAALPEREEYLDSEKYQLKERDWNAPGNIKDWITRLNRIRQRKSRAPSLRQPAFLPCGNDPILFYGKMTPARDNIILVVVNLDPFATQSFLHSRADRRIRQIAMATLPSAGPAHRTSVISGTAAAITSSSIPRRDPAHIFRVPRGSATELRLGLEEA